MRRHPTAPVNVARMRVAISGTDFTASEAAIRKFERNQADDFGVSVFWFRAGTAHQYSRSDMRETQGS
jgi:hypothetical protein